MVFLCVSIIHFDSPQHSVVLTATRICVTAFYSKSYSTGFLSA